jgi:hypothetical protein
MIWSPSIRGAGLRAPVGRGRHGAAGVAAAGFDPAQVDEIVAGELRVNGDVAKPALAAIIDLRRAGDLHRRAAGPPQADLAGLLGDQRFLRAGMNAIAQGSSKPPSSWIWNGLPDAVAVAAPCCCR